MKDEKIQKTETTIEWYEHTVSVEEYLEKCVDVPVFLEYCKECHNYRQVWSCPPFSFSPMEYWKKYRTFHIIGMKILLPSSLTQKKYTEEERKEVLDAALLPKKEALNKKLLDMEKEREGSVSLSGGSCQICDGGCTRPQGKPCRFPETMRYSIEALGGNVGLTVTKYLHQELQWMEEGKLPDYFMLIGGLLLP
ncbi:MAG: DUF2284 domain-containing protein [Eubacteriales bacterium]|nr:DUF2284 domain-containing protein [Eubacteriales bacterium]